MTQLVKEVTLTRVAHFSAAHRLHHAELPDMFYDKCSNLHGHNYKLEVTVKGPIDPISGYVLDIKLLQEIIETEVMQRFDHKNFDADIPYFENRVQSAENIALYIWDLIAPRIPLPAKLFSIRLYETEKNMVEVCA